MKPDSPAHFWTFKPIAGGLGGRPVFAVYAVMMVLQLLWVLFMMPETKGVPLEEIQRELGSRVLQNGD